LLLGRVKLPRAKTGAMQRRPEAVAGTGEMESGRGGIEAGVDAAEQDFQARRDDVTQAFACGSVQFSSAGPA
jgi:hypothetical protein